MLNFDISQIIDERRNLENHIRNHLKSFLVTFNQNQSAKLVPFVDCYVSKSEVCFNLENDNFFKLYEDKHGYINVVANDLKIDYLCNKKNIDLYVFYKESYKLATDYVAVDKIYLSLKEQ